MKDAYTLELPAGNMAAQTGETAPEVLTACALVYALAVSMSKTLPALALASVMPVVFVFTKRFTLSHFLKLNAFNAVMTLTLALTWPVMIDGALMGLMISARVNMIFLAFTVLVFPLGMSAAYSLPLPAKLRVLLILTLRGIFMLRENLQTALISVRLRAPNVKGMMKLKVFACILGGVLLKGSAKSERMMSAIVCRGGFGGFFQHERGGLSVKDVVILAGMMCYCLAILVMNYA